MERSGFISTFLVVFALITNVCDGNLRGKPFSGLLFHKYMDQKRYIPVPTFLPEELSDADTNAEDQPQCFKTFLVSHIMTHNVKVMRVRKVGNMFNGSLQECNGDMDLVIQVTEASPETEVLVLGNMATITKSLVLTNSDYCGYTVLNSSEVRRISNDVNCDKMIRIQNGSSSAVVGMAFLKEKS